MPYYTPIMKKKNIVRLALPTPLNRLFDYILPEEMDSTQLKVGMRLLVPFRSRVLAGWFIEYRNQTSYPLNKLKSVASIIDREPVMMEELYQLCTFASHYYHYPLGEILTQCLPTIARQKNTIPADNARDESIANQPLDKIIKPNEAQQKMIDTVLLSQNQFHSFLLDGVTGSGKTEVYMQVIQQIINNQKQVLVLVPEISLTPQMIERFKARFNFPIVAHHSGLTNKERYQTWLLAKNGEARVMIGTRSAVFTSFQSLGLIVIDETETKHNHFRIKETI